MNYHVTIITVSMETQLLAVAMATKCMVFQGPKTTSKPLTFWDVGSIYVSCLLIVIRAFIG